MYYPLYDSQLWYPSPDSNGEHTPFERAASTNCARGALSKPQRAYIAGPLPDLNPTLPPSSSMRFNTSSNKIGAKSGVCSTQTQ